MDVFQIEGPVRLSGHVEVNGSKNASLPIMAAALLAPGRSTLLGVPRLADISVFKDLIEQLGCQVERQDDGMLAIDATTIDNPVGPYDIVRKMRASICILGPLLARCGRVEVSMPGGCAIGDRPIDLHLSGVRQLGAQIHLKNGYVIAEAPGGLTGANIFLGGAFGSTVLGTANVMMAATLAKGRTVIESAACEPEVEDLANFLNAAGARIQGAGTPRIVIEGVEELAGIEHHVIPDRIEAGTFMIAAALTNGEVLLRNVRLDHLMAVVDKLREIGAIIERADGGAEVSSARRLESVDVTI